MARLRRSSPEDPGWTRRRAGKGFVYLDESGQRVGPQDVERVKGLVIPPAWRDVWICPWPNGHLQAVGTDDAGRRQYLYHPVWRAQRDAGQPPRGAGVRPGGGPARARGGGGARPPGGGEERGRAGGGPVGGPRPPPA